MATSGSSSYGCECTAMSETFRLATRHGAHRRKVDPSGGLAHDGPGSAVVRSWFHSVGLVPDTVAAGLVRLVSRVLVSAVVAIRALQRLMVAAAVLAILPRASEPGTKSRVEGPPVGAGRTEISLPVLLVALAGSGVADDGHDENRSAVARPPLLSPTSLLGGPALKFWSEPKLDPSFAEVDRRPWHVCIAMLVHADRIWV